MVGIVNHKLKEVGLIKSPLLVKKALVFLFKGVGPFEAQPRQKEAELGRRTPTKANRGSPVDAEALRARYEDLILGLTHVFLRIIDVGFASTLLASSRAQL